MGGCEHFTQCRFLFRVLTALQQRSQLFIRQAIDQFVEPPVVSMVQIREHLQQSGSDHIEEVDVHLFFVSGLGAVVLADKKVRHRVVIDPVADLLFEDAAASVKRDTVAVLPFVFVEGFGIETHVEAELIEERSGLRLLHSVVPCA